MRITMQSRFAANNTLLMRSNGCFLVNMDRKKKVWLGLVWLVRLAPSKITYNNAKNEW